MSFKDKFQQFIEGANNPSGGRNGWKFASVALIALLGWTGYSWLFLQPTKQESPLRNTSFTSPKVPDVTPPPERDETPIPPAKLQTTTPPKLEARQVTKPKPKSMQQECRELARLYSNYSGPFDQAWTRLAKCSGNTGREAQDSQMKPQQVLEVPSAHQNGHAYQNGNGEPGVLQPPQSPYMVMRGSVIPVALQEGFDTQVPGQITAIVIQDIKDTRTGKYVMVPKGTTVIGSYDIDLPYDQNRIRTAWNRMNFPNGETIDLTSFPGADRSGAAGTPVDVNTHFWKTFGRSLLLTVSGAAAQMGMSSSYHSGDLSAEEALARQAGMETQRRSRQMWDRGGYRGPTGTAKAGEVFLLQVTQDMGPFPGDYYERNRGMYAESD